VALYHSDDRQSQAEVVAGAPLAGAGALLLTRSQSATAQRWTYRIEGVDAEATLFRKDLPSPSGGTYFGPLLPLTAGWTAFAALPQRGGELTELVASTLSEQGELLGTRMLELPRLASADKLFESGGKDLMARLCYAKDPVPVWNPEMHISFATGGSGTGVYAVLATCGYTLLTHLHGDGTLDWQKTVFSTEGVPEAGTEPAPSLYPGQRALAVADDGSVIVAFALPEGFQTEALARRLAVAPRDLGAGSVLIVCYNAQGQERWRQVVKAQAPRSVYDAAIGPDRVYLVGEERRAKDLGAQHQHEYDLLTMALDRRTGALRSQRVTDLDHDDTGTRVLFDPQDGTLVVGVHSDYVQVDTGSVIQPGHVTLVRLKPDLTEKERLTFGSDRDDWLATLAFAANGELFVAGCWSGPITHTPETARWEQGFYARLPRRDWATIGVRPTPRR